MTPVRARSRRLRDPDYGAQTPDQVAANYRRAAAGAAAQVDAARRALNDPRCTPTQERLLRARIENPTAPRAVVANLLGMGRAAYDSALRRAIAALSSPAGVATPHVTLGTAQSRALTRLASQFPDRYRQLYREFLLTVPPGRQSRAQTLAKGQLKREHHDRYRVIYGEEVTRLRAKSDTVSPSR